MWELDHTHFHTEVWKNWCFWTVVLEKTLESPLNCKEIKPVNHKGNQPWVFILRTDAEAEVPVLWPPDAKSQLTGKKPWCWERLRAEGEGGNRGWNGWIASHSGHDFKQTPRNNEEQGKPGIMESMKTRLSDCTATTILQMGLPNGSVVKNPPVNAGDLDSWVRKIPWKGKPTPVLLPGKSHG